MGLTEKVSDLWGEVAVVLLQSVLLPVLSSIFLNDTMERITHLPPYCTCMEHGAGGAAETWEHRLVFQTHLSRLEIWAGDDTV